MSNEQKTAARAIDEVRIKAGISQKRLAEKMGLKTQQAVNSMLNGRKNNGKNNMRVDNLVKAMDALGYDVIVRNRVTDEEIQIVMEDGTNENKKE